MDQADSDRYRRMSIDKLMARGFLACLFIVAAEALATEVTFPVALCGRVSQDCRGEGRSGASPRETWGTDPGEPKNQLGRLVTAFVAWALLSESAVFAHYYITYGYDDPKLSVGIGVSFIDLE